MIASGEWVLIFLEALRRRHHNSWRLRGVLRGTSKETGWGETAIIAATSAHHACAQSLHRVHQDSYNLYPPETHCSELLAEKNRCGCCYTNQKTSSASLFVGCEGLISFYCKNTYCKTFKCWLCVESKNRG